MAKVRTRYVCQNCGRQSPRYMGRCPACGEFNTMIEEIIETGKIGGKAEARSRTNAAGGRAQRLSEVSLEAEPRLSVPVAEFNRVLGGGIVPGSIVLIG
ncbi:MAG: DNA repair protein RadA, partial [Anaerolinea sp.]|nr:DNA repair protein RadA [Anaerolinea sp.]